MPRKSNVRDIYLEAFLYDLCYNLTPEQTSKLKLKSRNMLKQENRVKRFIEGSTMDEKINFLEEIGIGFGLFVTPEKIINKSSFKVLLEKYSSMSFGEAAKSAAQMKFFVTTDREITFISGLMASTVHTKSYLLNLDYNKVGNIIKDWNKRLSGTSFDIFNEANEGCLLLAKALYNAIVVKENAEHKFGLKEEDLCLLLFMYANKHIYIPRDRVCEIFYSIFRSHKKVNYTIRRLVDSFMIRNHVHVEPQRYMITTEGIRVCNEYIHTVLSANNT